MEINSSTIKSIPASFRDIALSRRDRIAIRHKEHGLWKEISWHEYYLNASYLAQALMKLDVPAGAFVGIIGENCPEWLYMDMGIQMAGAKSVGIYATNSWQQLQYILEHSNCQVLFAENEEQVDKWLQARDQLPNLRHIIYWDKKGLEKVKDPQVLYFEDLLEMGRQSFNIDSQLHHTRIDQVAPGDTAMLIYTSGTTGNPKGVMLSSHNIIWTSQRLQLNDKDLIRPADQTLSFLPLCHIFERMFGVYLHLSVGYIVNFAESLETIPQNLTEIRPTVGYAVPRIWEKIQSSILIRMSDAPWLNRQVFSWAKKVGHQYIEKVFSGEKISPFLSLKRFLAYWIIFYPLKRMVGLDKMRYAISGAAPISPDVIKFFHMLGIPVIEGYGMTETSCIITLANVKDYRLGTVGKPIDDNTVKLGEDGEILVRHNGVTGGYYKNPDATAEAFSDGWLHTGDIGMFDSDGYLSIIDRKKDLIITAAGKNIAPQKIESKLKFSPYINDAIVIGDRKKFLSAIIVLDEENINKYTRIHKISYSSYSDLANNPQIQKLIETEVNKVNHQLARVENVRKFTILDKRLYVEDGEVTPTMKVKRKFINEQYHDLIENMYT